MKKFVLAAVAAAAAASFSLSALAVDLSSPTPVPDTFASELVTAGTTAVKTTPVITDLGFGVSATQTRFIRYDFTNSKIGAGGITAADLAIVGVPPADIIVSSGGTAGSTNVIFQFTAPAAGVAQDGDVTLTLANGLVPTVLGPIDATYRLYETAAAAVAGAGQLAQDSGTIIVFASGVSLTAKQTTSTVNVATSPTYTQFVAAVPAGIPTTTLAEIGKVSLNTANAKKPDGALVTLPDMLGAGTAITLSGADLTAAVADLPGPTGLTLNAGGCAAPATTLGTSRTATSVSFVLPNPVTPIADASLCFAVPAANKTPIAAQSFTADVAPGPVANVPLPDVPAVAAGTFIRNGLVLKAAFAETTTSGVSSTANLTNTTGNPAPFTVNCVLNSGTVAGTPGTLPASTAQRFTLGANGLGCPSNGTLRGVEIVFGTTPGSVIGSIVRQNVTTGQASFDGMVGNQ